MSVILIFDFDGTIVKSSRTENFCRWIFEKIGLSRPPRICLAISEIVDFFRFLLNMKKVIADNHLIEIIREKNLPVGILTDRSKFSLSQHLWILGIKPESLDFIQTRRSFLDIFSREKKFFTSRKIKPNKSVYLENLIPFVEGSGLDTKNIIIIDDLPSIRGVAKRLGLQAMDPVELKR